MRASSGAVKRRWREELAAASAEESASSSDDADADATAELARWCREQRRMGRADAGAALQASQRDPRRFLSTLGASDDGRAFLLSLVRRRQRELAAAADAPRRAARAHAALGSLREHLGELEPAISHVVAAARLRGALPATPDGADDLDGELRRALAGGGGELLGELARLLRQRHANTALAALRAAPAPPPGETWALPRAPAGLSVADLFAEYSARRVPVVLTLPPGAGPAEAFTLAHLRRTIGDKKPVLRRRDAESIEWAGLEPTTPQAQTTVAEFIDTLDALAAEAEPPYLFDWSLPQHCADELLRGGFRVPRYFANDLLQRLEPGSLYRDAWPSLFVGPAGSRCSVHVDTFGSHFWMLLFEGEKRWTIFPPDAAPLLRPSYAHGHDPIFGADVHGAAADDDELLRRAPRWEGVLKAGECLFVPAGCPHAVANLTKTSAISANFVLPDNLELARQELRVAACACPEARRVAAQLDDPGFDAAADVGVGEVAWDAFKRS